jgi:hypothetical protein
MPLKGPKKGEKMFLNDKEKSSRKTVLKSLLGKLGEVDSQKFKKPVAIEVETAEVAPASGLLGEMKKAGHEGVEEAEEQLFPAEEEKEEAMESGGVDEQTKMMIKQLYEKYCV